jgi:micrococcal nuclease
MKISSGQKQEKKGSWRYSWGLIAIALGIFLLGCQAPTPTGKIATIRRIISGNSLEVLMAEQNPPQAQTIRLIGLDAPRLQQAPWGQAAKDYLESRLPPQTPVILEIKEESRDRYNRIWGYLWLDDELINETILQQGWAVATGSSSPYQTRLDRAQAYARIMGHGIWNPQNPLRQTPAAFQAPQ